MKITKVLFIAFSFILTLASVNELTANNNPIGWKDKIMNYLNDFDKVNDSNVPDKVLVDFILNEKGEMMILSTSHNEIEEWLKSKLNYKEIGFQELKAMEKYTLPIVFKKK